MKLRSVCSIIFAALLSSATFAQVPSRFDLSANFSYDGATLPNGTANGMQVRAFGGQTSGVTRFNRWFAVTSQFGVGYATADSIQLIGYTGPGTMQHYSALVGPRITIPTHSRISPFFEGLGGADRASTKLVSNGIPVTGREIQTAYAFGGGAQIDLSRHFGLNFEGQYFGSQHTLAFTGWVPSHIVIAAGIVIRMSAGGVQIAERRSSSRPIFDASAQQVPSQPSTQSAEAESSRISESVSPQPVVPMPRPEVSVQPQTTFASDVRIPSVPVAAIAPIATVATPIAAQPYVVSNTSVSAPQATSAAAISASPRQIPTTTQPAAAPTATARAQQNVNQVPVQSVAPSRPLATTTYSAPPSTSAQVQPEPAPMSLGEYARRLREKKQQQAKQ